MICSNARENIPVVSYPASNGRRSAGETTARRIVLYLHCILITSSHKVELREESATFEAVGMQRGYNLSLSTATRGGGWVAKLTVV